MPSQSQRFPMRHRISLLFFIVFSVLIFGGSRTYAGHDIPNRRVLVLHETVDASPGRLTFSSEFFRLMQENSDFNVNVTFEFLGLNLLNNGEPPTQAIESLKYLTANENVDVVLSLLPSAAKFLLTYGEELFPDTPKVFVLPGASMFGDISQLPQSAIIKTSAETAISETTSDIFSILPDTEQLIVISGSTPTDLSYLSSAQRIIPDVVPDNIHIEYLVGLPHADIEEQLISLPEHTAVLMLLYEGDTEGVSYQFSTITRELSNVSPAPIFSIIEIEIATGAVGGATGSMALYAKNAAEIVTDILNRPQTARYNMVVEGDTVTVYDATSLKHWNIPISDLPPHSMLINNEVTFWEAYGDFIAIVIIIIFLQSMLIMALVLSRRRRIRAEASLKSSEGRFRAIFDNSSDAIGVSLQGKHVFVNNAYREIFGIAPDFNLMDLPILDYIAPDEHERIMAYVRSRVTDKQAPTYYETRGKRADNGQEFDMEVRLSTFPMDDGVYSVVFLRDISERKAYEEMRHIDEQRMRSLGNALPDPVMMLNRDGVLLDVFTSRPELLVSNIETLKGTSLYDFNNGTLKKNVEYAFATQEIVIINYELDVILGRRWFEGRIVPMPGTVDGDELFLLVARDITERKRSDDLLKARLRLSEFALDHSINELLQKTLDEAEILTQSSIGFYHFLEEDQNTIVLATWSSNTIEHMCQVVQHDVHYPIEQAGVWADVVRVGDRIIHNDMSKVENKRGFPAGHAPVKREIVMPVKRNNRVVAIVGVGNKLTPYTEEDVNMLYQVANMSWDIISGLKAQISLKQSEEILALKDQFITMISHEFRTPMAVIQTSSDMLQNYYDRMSEERKKQLLTQISEQVHHMTEMVTNTLTISKSQRGIIQFVPALMAIEPFCQKMLKQVKAADNINHTYHCDISLQDEQIVLDQHLLEHILLNLLLNASKYTPAGGEIHLTVTDDNDNLTLIVKDNGIGIPEDALPDLFDSFYRAPNVSNIQGTGLGLAIVRQFVDMHHGSIKVESQQNKGSEFTITLPKNLEPAS